MSFAPSTQIGNFKSRRRAIRWFPATAPAWDRCCQPGNAVHYGDVATPITVTVAGNDPDAVTINVHNLGSSIPLEAQKSIFQSWTRGHDDGSPPEHSTHLGLGLYIAKLIVEAHGGEISVASNHVLFDPTASQVTVIL